MRPLPFMMHVSCLFVLVAPTFAADGVVEISQVCAVHTGCFTEDTAGYPISIDGTSGRSYRLTSDLIVPNENTDGIIISTSSITVDLNGFEIVRAGCEGATTNCTPSSGTGSGVKSASASALGLAVKNGSITGMGSSGVQLVDQAEVTNLRIRWNRIDGITTGNGSTVSNNTAHQNGRDGVRAGNGSTISGNTGYLNGGNGIFGNSGSTMSGNTAHQNGVNGIACFNSCAVYGNTAFENGDATNPDGDDGIQCVDGCMVHDNIVRSNSGYGLNLGSSTAYRENVITDNAAGTVTGGLNAGDNACNGTLTCP